MMVEGLRCVFDRHPAIEIVGQSPDVATGMAELSSVSADILLLGQPFFAKSILPLFSEATESKLRVATVLWVNEVSEVDCSRALHMGARGIVTKSEPVQTLIDCLETVAGGSIYVERKAPEDLSAIARRNGAQRITPREWEIVGFVCRGMGNKEIADATGITPGTVKVHLMHIFEKTGVKDRLQLALQGQRLLGAANRGVLPGKAAHA